MSVQQTRRLTWTGEDSSKYIFEFYPFQNGKGATLASREFASVGHHHHCHHVRRCFYSKHAVSAFTVAHGLFFHTRVALAKHGRQLGWTRLRPARSLLSALVRRGCARVHALGRRRPGPGELSWTRPELHAGCGLRSQSSLDPRHVTQGLAPERSWPWKSRAV